MKIISPVTFKGNTKLKDTILSQTIIDLYKNDLDTDVSRLFKGIDNVSIYECLDTGYLFYYPFNIVGDEKLYDDLKIKMPEIYHTPYYPTWKWEYDIALKLIAENSSVLEVGCGSGVFLNKLSSINPNRKLKGLELNKFSVKEAITKGIDAQVETIQDFSKTNGYLYDVVSFFQVLEHVYEVHSFLETSIACLKNSGQLIIAVPFNEPYLFKNDILNTLNLPPHHMGLWNEAAFKNLTKVFPLKLDKIVIENLPDAGYDFDRFYQVNKDTLYKPSYPFKSLFDKLYYRYLKKYHARYHGKNIIAVYTKQSD